MVDNKNKFVHKNGLILSKCEATSLKNFNNDLKQSKILKYNKRFKLKCHQII